MGCLCAADSCADGLQLDPGCSAGLPGASKERVLQALQTIPEVAATLQSRLNREGPNAEGFLQLRVIISAAAAAAESPEGYTAMLRSLPLFELAGGGFAAAERATCAPSQAWEDSVAACRGLLRGRFGSLAVLALHRPTTVQGHLLRAANLEAPDECSWLMNTLLPRLTEDAADTSRQQRTSQDSLKRLLMAALHALAGILSSRPFTDEEQARLAELPIVVDADGRQQTASRFVLLEGAADGLRPLMAGPEWPLQALPAEYSAFVEVLKAGGLHTHIDSSLFTVIAQCCHSGALARLPAEALPPFRDALAAAAAAAQPAWEPSELAKLPVFLATDDSLVAFGAAWVAPDLEWQQLLHYHRVQLPLPVLHWHGADATQRRLLDAAGATDLQLVAMSVERDLLPYISAHRDNRRLEPLLLHSLRCLESTADGVSLLFKYVVFGNDGSAQWPSCFTLLASCNNTIESLLPESQFPRLPSHYHRFAALLASAGLQTTLSVKMLECCIRNFQQQHAAGTMDPIVGITLLEQILSQREHFFLASDSLQAVAFKQFVMGARCVSLSSSERRSNPYKKPWKSF